MNACESDSRRHPSTTPFTVSTRKRQGCVSEAARRSTAYHHEADNTLNKPSGGSPSQVFQCASATGKWRLMNTDSVLSRSWLDDSPASVLIDAPIVMLHRPVFSETGCNPRCSVFVDFVDSRRPTSSNHGFHELDAFREYSELRILPFLRQRHKSYSVADLEFLRVRHRRTTGRCIWGKSASPFSNHLRRHVVVDPNASDVAAARRIARPVPRLCSPRSRS